MHMTVSGTSFSTLSEPIPDPGYLGLVSGYRGYRVSATTRRYGAAATMKTTLGLVPLVVMQNSDAQQEIYVDVMTYLTACYYQLRQIKDLCLFLLCEKYYDFTTGWHGII